MKNEYISREQSLTAQKMHKKKHDQGNQEEKEEKVNSGNRRLGSRNEKCKSISYKKEINESQLVNWNRRINEEWGREDIRDF